MQTPHLRLEDSGATFQLSAGVTTVRSGVVNLCGAVINLGEPPPPPPPPAVAVPPPVVP